jgi:hypothetical protein
LYGAQRRHLGRGEPGNAGPKRDDLPGGERAGLGGASAVACLRGASGDTDADDLAGLEIADLSGNLGIVEAGETCGAGREDLVGA